MMQPLNLRLPSSLIPELQKPMGIFVKTDPKLLPPEKRVAAMLLPKQKTGSLVVCIGDFVSRTLIQEKFIPDLIIIDNYTQRTKKSTFPIEIFHEIKEVENSPGQINETAWRLIKNEFLKLEKKPSINTNKSLPVIIIKGEEDLLALPAILEAPVGSYVLYGQPPMIGDGSSGIILIEINEDVKSRVENLLNKFDQI